MYGEGKVANTVLVGNPGERDHLEDLGVDGRTLNKTSKSGMAGMDLLDLSQDRDRRRDLVNAGMNHRVVPQHAGNFLTS
jgi:hypothetical protein